MSDLIRKIQTARVDAAERAVLEDLAARGLASQETLNLLKDPKDTEIARLRASHAELLRAHQRIATGNYGAIDMMQLAKDAIFNAEKV